MPQEKLNYITKAQTLGIILVVLGHCMPTSMRALTPQAFMWAYYCIYSFHMPFFMFLAGYLFVYTSIKQEIDYPRFIVVKAKRLLIPYIVVNLIAFFPKNVLSRFAERSISYSLSGFIKGLLYPFTNVIFFLWFLPTLFLIFLIAPIFKNILVKNNILVALIVGLFLSVLAIARPLHAELLNIGGACVYLVYFYFGCVASYYKNKRKGLSTPWCMVLALLVLIGLNYVLLNKLIPAQITGLLQFLTACAGITFAFLCAHVVDSKNINFFNYLDGYYYQIFLLSWFVQVFLRILFQMGLLNYPVAFISMLIGGLYLPVLATKFIVKKTPALKFVIGL